MSVILAKPQPPKQGGFFKVMKSLLFSEKPAPPTKKSLMKIQPVENTVLKVDEDDLDRCLVVLGENREVHRAVEQVYFQSCACGGLMLISRAKTSNPMSIKEIMGLLSGDDLFLAFDIVVSAASDSAVELKSLLGKIESRDRAIKMMGESRYSCIIPPMYSAAVSRRQ